MSFGQHRFDDDAISGTRWGRTLFMTMCIALSAWGCSGLKSGEDTGGGDDRDALADTSVATDGKAADVSAEQRSNGVHDGDLSQDGSSGDQSSPDVSVDMTPPDAVSDDVGASDAGGADHDVAIVDAPVGDIFSKDFENDAGALEADADASTPRDAGVNGDSLDAPLVDAKRYDGHPPIVIYGHITEFVPPMSVVSMSDIAAGPDGALWMPNPENRSLIRMTTAGQFTEYPLPDQDIDGGPRSYPRRIIVGPDNALWVSEGFGSDGIGRITRMTLEGVFTSFPLPPTVNPLGLAFGSDGNLWFSDWPNRTVDRLLLSNGEVTPFTLLNSPWPEPGEMITGSDGNLWFVESSPNKIGRMTTQGVFTEFTVPVENGAPNDITMGHDGNLWFPITMDLIGRITPSGAIDVVPLRETDGSPSGTVAIATGSDGSLWVPSGRGIISVTPDGTTVKEYPCAPDCSPASLALGSDNLMWYVDGFRRTIGRITP